MASVRVRSNSSNGHRVPAEQNLPVIPASAKQAAAMPKPHSKVAYIMSRFPKITETFILYEMQAMEEQGLQVEVYPLLREKTTVMHPEAVPFVERANFQPFISGAILRAHLHFLRRKPRAYARTLWTLLRANLGSFRYFTGALGIFPKSVYFAYTMAAEQITHIHAHFASHPAAAAFIIHRLTEIPYSFTAHGSDLHRDRHMLCEKVAESAFTVTISNFNREIILAECGRQFEHKVMVVHCGVNTKIFQPRSEPTPHERGEGPFAILCIGTLHEVKGQTYLIEACKLLDERGLDFICHFAGDGPDLEALTKQAAQAGLTDRVCFHGRLTQAGITELLKEADVVVAPSVPSKDGRREGIPVVLMEALGSGVPAIASDLSGIPELVKDGENGFLVEPGDVQNLAKALEYLYNHPELRRQFGKTGRDKVIREFDLDQNATVLARQFSLQEIQ